MIKGYFVYMDVFDRGKSAPVFLFLYKLFFCGTLLTNNPERLLMYILSVVEHN